MNNSNLIYAVSPTLIKYFVNKEEAYENSMGSGKKVELKCPECGTVKKMRIYKFTRYGLSCPRCSDGISIPQKFILGVLLEMGVSFEPEKVFNWSGKKRYDFYIDRESIIIEVHGSQHYKNCKHWGGLDKQIENDSLKREWQWKTVLRNI